MDLETLRTSPEYRAVRADAVKPGQLVCFSNPAFNYRVTRVAADHLFCRHWFGDEDSSNGYRCSDIVYVQVGE